MSRVTIQRPIYGIRCDHPGCDEQFVPDNAFDRSIDDGHGARPGARKAGWQVRPARGAGSRSAPDLCPAHRTDTTEDGAR